MFSAVLRIFGDHLDTDGVSAFLPMTPCRIDRTGVAGIRANCLVYDMLPEGIEKARRVEHIEGMLRGNRDCLNLVSRRKDVEGCELDIMIGLNAEDLMVSETLGKSFIAILSDCGVALVISCVATSD